MFTGMKILGISAYYHDSAAALVVLEMAGVKPVQLDHIAFYDKPFLKFERLLETSRRIPASGN